MVAGMYGIGVFPIAPTAPSSVQIDPNQQLTDLIGATNNVRTAIENIQQATPQEVDLSELLAEVRAEIALIDAFKQQADANEISTKNAVDSVRVIVEQLKQTVEDGNQALRDAIAEASEDEQATLTARLNAGFGGLEGSLVSEFNESQAIATEQSQKLTTLIDRLSGTPEPLVPVSANIDTKDGAKEFTMPAGWRKFDLQPNYRDRDGVQSLEGPRYVLESGGHTEETEVNAHIQRESGNDILGKPNPTLAIRIVVNQAPSTTHVVFYYPQSIAAAITVMASSGAGSSPTPPVVPSSPSAEELVAGLAGNAADANDQPFVEDIVGVWDFINVGATLQQAFIAVRVAEEQSVLDVK